MALDNPSYFSIASGSSSLPSTSRNKFTIFKKLGKMGSGASTSPTPTDDSNASGGSQESCLLYNRQTTTPSPNSSLPSRRGNNIRTLLRSVSANSSESNPELLILGEPRPCDVAPPSPIFTRSFTGSSSQKSGTSSRKSPKSILSEMQCEDLVYCPLPTSDDEADKLSEEAEEVFLAEDSARYYNLAIGNNRRHSIGTYYNRDRKSSIASTSRSLKEDFPPSTSRCYREDFSQPIIEFHATAEGETRKPTLTPNSTTDYAKVTFQTKKKCSQCCLKGSGRSTGKNMEDILIVSSRHSQTAGLWVNYLITCFEQISQQRTSKHPFKILHIGLEEVTGASGVSTALEEKIASVKLQVVIVCPSLLEHVAEHPGPSSTLGRLLQPDRVLAILLGVQEDDVSEQHRSALVSYYQWRRLIVRDKDPTFINDFLSMAGTILSRVWRKHHSEQDKSQFSIIPKKVKLGQNRVIVLLNEPLTTEDVVRVTVDKQGKFMEVESVKRRNPYTLQFSIPDNCMKVSMIITVGVEKNGTVLGYQPIKCESRLRELDQILRASDNPLEFMCQTLGFSAACPEALDNWMVNAFQRNLPPHFNLITAPIDVSQRKINNSPEEYPTLLHFAARFGLEKLAWQLLECPGGEQACEIRNVCDLTPTEMAEAGGHLKLANALKGYMQMNEFSNIYQLLKGMSEKKEETSETSGEYLLPRPLDETYSVPPTARPFTPSSSPNAQSFTGYMEMHPSGKNTPTPSRTQSIKRSKSPNHSRSVSPAKSLDRFTEIKPVKVPENVNQSNDYSQNKQSSKFHNLMLEDRVQTELAEIINDFKNNVITIQEVEKLVENWKNRNDVKQSFKHKQEKLNEMREQYNRIQQMMKTDMKRQTPFDRIKKFFSKGKSKSSDNILKEKDDTYSNSSQQSKIGMDGFTCPNHRPVSSLSCQSSSSSSSSARMSTASGCSGVSFGDSGTHSDTDDRKHSMVQSHNSDSDMPFGKNMDLYYKIPPPPKPCFNKNGVQSSRLNPLPPQTTWKFNTIEENSPQSKQIETDTHYILFPPSGLPINPVKLNQIKEMDHPNENDENCENIDQSSSNGIEYMNIGVNNTDIVNLNLNNNQEEKDRFPEYMNCTIGKKKIPPPTLPKSYSKT